MTIATVLQSHVGTFNGYIQPDIPRADSVANAQRMSISNRSVCQHVTDWTRTIYYCGDLVKHASWDNQTGLLTLEYVA